MAAQANGDYTFAQLEAIWIQAGGSKLNAAMAAAIAMAESGGNPNATNDNGNGSVDRGLWQINSSHGSQSTYDPLANARAAVAISNNGSTWRPWCTAYSDGLCGTKGGTYLGSGSPFSKFLGSAGTGSAINTATNTSPNSGNEQYASFPTDQGSAWYNWIIPFGLGGVTGGTSSTVMGLPLGSISSTIESGLASAIMDVLKPVGKVLLYTLYVVGGAGLMLLGLWYMAKDVGATDYIKGGETHDEMEGNIQPVKELTAEPAPSKTQGQRASKQQPMLEPTTQGGRHRGQASPEQRTKQGGAGTHRGQQAREGRTSKAASKAKEAATVAEVAA